MRPKRRETGCYRFALTQEVGAQCGVVRRSECLILRGCRSPFDRRATINAATSGTCGATFKLPQSRGVRGVLSADSIEASRGVVCHAPNVIGVCPGVKHLFLRVVCFLSPIE